MTMQKRVRRWVIGSCLGLGITGMLLYGLAVPLCSASEPETTSSSVRHTPPPQRSLNPLDPSVAPRNWQHQTDSATTASQCDDLAL
jgi:hypothetical protein